MVGASPETRIGCPGALEKPKEIEMPFTSRRRVTTAVRGLLASVPIDADLTAFMARVADWRRRSVVLVPFRAVLPDDVPTFSGLWVKAPSFDCVVYDDTAAPMTQRHSVFHELGHMLLGHLSEGDLEEVQFRLMCRMLPDLDPEFIRATIRAGLCRSTCGGQDSYAPAQEREAEEFATELALRASSADLIHPVRPIAPSDRAVIDRFTSTLGPTPRRGR
ncbi:ImmA/IrrE family metallo-endopeptidase [Amycolatopsis anabasis]|uniref:ImmA/IrrE family metallo-endopeptidase n=1 Tax=Amycolatopsis anabasis TaxID=1840409 RepID=UPI00131B6740|nr:ImmA/IrrE family metallo-endopeptidase [Amycolatopsis anabasis]